MKTVENGGEKGKPPEGGKGVPGKKKTTPETLKKRGRRIRKIPERKKKRCHSRKSNGGKAHHKQAKTGGGVLHGAVIPPQKGEKEIDFWRRDARRCSKENHPAKGGFAKNHKAERVNPLTGESKHAPKTRNYLRPKKD